MMVSCAKVTSLKEAYVDDRLGPDVRAAVEAHSASCELCSKRISLAYGVKTRLSGAMKLALEKTAPAHNDIMAMQARVEERLSAAPRGRQYQPVFSPAMLAIVLTATAIMALMWSSFMDPISKHDVIYVVPSTATPSVPVYVPEPERKSTSIARATSDTVPPRPNPKNIPANVTQTPIPLDIPEQVVLPQESRTPSLSVPIVDATRVPTKTQRSAATPGRAANTPVPGKVVQSPAPTRSANSPVPASTAPVAQTSLPTVASEGPPSNDASSKPEATRTIAPLPTRTPDYTHTPVTTYTRTRTPLPTQGSSETSTPLPTEAAAPKPTRKPTETSTPLPTEAAIASHTPQPTRTASRTSTPTSTPMNTQVSLATSTPQSTNTPQGYTPTPLPSSTSTPIPTQAPKETGTPLPTNTPNATNTPLPSWTPRPTNTPRPSWTPQPSWTPRPTNTPRPSGTPHPPPPTGTRTPHPPPPPFPSHPPEPQPTETCLPETPGPTATPTWMP
ncbi:MAG TPA: hypothetical protein VJ183_10795 [Chloroflexia bacterium]|nr:hypothetical protein [Chloroflexia bacterium]